MARFTLLEVHLEDAEFTANAPYSGGEGSVRDELEEVMDGDDGESGGSMVGPLVGLLVAVGLVVAVRKLISSEEEFPAEDEPEVPLAGD